MASSFPKTLALDFDGVICDGLVEYFQTAWQAYCELFQTQQQNPPAGLAERFYPLRPVIESGWEMPILLHALQVGYGDGDILRNWGAIAPHLTQAANLDPAHVAAVVDGVRDRWIHQDLDGWLSQHRFYPGVIERIQQAQQAGLELLIISTKEGRFIQQLLSQAGLNLEPRQILGKEVKRPKYQTLQQLQAKVPVPIWFIEDRINALMLVKQQPDLDGVSLFLAAWGYNTVAEKQQARQDSRIALLELETFSQAFDSWVPENLKT